jgi:hypothetical protein
LIVSRGRAARPCLLGAAVIACACAADREPVADETTIDMRACVAAVATSSGSNAAACPAFLFSTVTDAWQSCREAGGRLAPVEPASVWSFDLNGDSRPEHAFEIDDVVYCEQAWSLFSCGSLGCPKGLYAERDGAWQFIGSISASSRDAIEVTDTVHADGYHDFSVGCGTDQECVENWHYLWRDGFYEATSVDVRGYRVAFADSVHGLYPLVEDTTLLATPTTAGPPLDRYGAGTEVAIIGTAEASAYFYVSPCNACVSGFVPTSALPPLRAEQP